jgi:hypothetical protein
MTYIQAYHYVNVLNSFTSALQGECDHLERHEVYDSLIGKRGICGLGKQNHCDVGGTDVGHWRSNLISTRRKQGWSKQTPEPSPADADIRADN